jgi:DeoR/GlpR family transcriptional regulator of sugar metabolism
VLIQAERAMIRHAEELIVLADETKFGAIGTLLLAPIEQATTVITTKEAPPSIVDAIREKGVKVVTV